jgi:hypothetical protein
MNCMVKIKDFNTETDGPFSLVSLVHLDSDDKVTGNFAIMKLKQDE